jgi:hypothetical protein
VIRNKRLVNLWMCCFYFWFCTFTVLDRHESLSQPSHLRLGHMIIGVIMWSETRKWLIFVNVLFLLLILHFYCNWSAW